MWRKYQPTAHVAERPVEPPTEEDIQTLWFEQWFPAVLRTDDGDTIEVVQPGNWNHGAGPDFLQAAIRHNDGHVSVGAVELHLRATDWDAHGHHIDPAYNDTILHVTWEPPAKTYFPTTHHFRRVPQLILKDQLIAPWESLRAHLPFRNSTLPIARAGLCQKRLAESPRERVLEILRAAGAYRLRHKSQRLGWRVEAVGAKQALWESLAEGLGYSHNKIPFRLIAQRLPHARLLRLPRDKRQALIFGLSGLLPATSLAAFAPDVREWIKPQWDHWWKVRATYDFAILPRTAWKLAGLRPWNRPERRLAALGALVPLLASLHQAVINRDASTFGEILDSIAEPFWDVHTTFTAGPLTKRHHLVGSERIADLITNVFWPLVAIQDATLAENGWQQSEARPNQITELARQRVLGEIDLKPHLHETLVQQGLHQIYTDYCVKDVSACEDCSFPGIVLNWD